MKLKNPSHILGVKLVNNGTGIVAQSNDTLDEIPQSDFVSTTTTGNQTSQAGSSSSPTNERDCGIRPLFQRRKPRVVGGRDAYFGEWPWQVMPSLLLLYHKTIALIVAGYVDFNRYLFGEQTALEFRFTSVEVPSSIVDGSLLLLIV